QRELVSRRDERGGGGVGVLGKDAAGKAGGQECSELFHVSSFMQACSCECNGTRDRTPVSHLVRRVCIAIFTDGLQGLTATTSTSTTHCGRASPATCSTERTGVLGCSAVPKNCV